MYKDYSEDDKVKDIRASKSKGAGKDNEPTYVEAGSVYTLYKDLEEAKKDDKGSQQSAHKVDKKEGHTKGKGDGASPPSNEALARVDFRNDYFWNEGNLF